MTKVCNKISFHYFFPIDPNRLHFVIESETKRNQLLTFVASSKNIGFKYS